jgi:hypothetical protein
VAIIAAQAVIYDTYTKISSGEPGEADIITAMAVISVLF